MADPESGLIAELVGLHLYVSFACSALRKKTKRKFYAKKKNSSKVSIKYGGSFIYLLSMNKHKIKINLIECI